MHRLLQHNRAVLTLICALACASAGVHAAAEKAAPSAPSTPATTPATQETSVPGGVYLWPVPAGATNVTFDGRPVMVHSGHALVGIPISAKPGEATLSYEMQGQTHSHTFQVHDKVYTEQRLTIANQDYVTPPEHVLARIREESARQRKLYRSFTTPRDLQNGMQKPLQGITTSLFGHRRILNGQPRSPHSGLDIAGDTGTPIIAAADGTVTLADDLYYNGNTLFIDHGQGLVTMYCHMSELKVQEGDEVAQGEVIGLVGATGRVTGPHLHWSVSLNGNRVDPLMLMSMVNRLNIASAGENAR